ncbi:hypothetical protein GR925_10720 [Streptomyces sp. HUCO-GS316]|uniref:hypothetical protein n=1 Tax=Streptomyces sp. HUCO-GS316 TaxID=2692198 RepID=UPI00136EE28C|nr:hypothetical protein [Streptomyces sp. HUCO-GS316]MXM63906.1 hypothetical protein [Streptomyces sp. HUCO-GS316]
MFRLASAGSLSSVLHVSVVQAADPRRPAEMVEGSGAAPRVANTPGSGRLNPLRVRASPEASALPPDENSDRPGHEHGKTGSEDHHEHQHALRLP